MRPLGLFVSPDLGDEVALAGDCHFEGCVLLGRRGTVRAQSVVGHDSGAIVAWAKIGDVAFAAAGWVVGHLVPHFIEARNIATALSANRSTSLPIVGSCVVLADRRLRSL